VIAWHRPFAFGIVSLLVIAWHRPFAFGKHANKGKELKGMKLLGYCCCCYYYYYYYYYYYLVIMVQC
jgi:hypothetical protein